MDKKAIKEKFKDGFFRGIGWSFGVTFGFVLVSVLLVLILHLLGGVPLIGKWIALLVKATQANLVTRTPIAP